MNNPMNQKPGNLKLNFSYCTQQPSGPGEVTLFLWSTIFHVARVSYLSSPLGSPLSISNSASPNLNHWFLSPLPIFSLNLSLWGNKNSYFSHCSGQKPWSHPRFRFLNVSPLHSEVFHDHLTQNNPSTSILPISLPWFILYCTFISLFQYTVISKDYRIGFNSVPIFISNRVSFQYLLNQGVGILPWIKPTSFVSLDKSEDYCGFNSIKRCCYFCTSLLPIPRLFVLLRGPLSELTG